jgi:hypothetical protein
MQVQVIENQADVVGRILDVRPHETLANYHVARIDVEEVFPVGDYPNLFSWAPGKSIEVNIPAEKVAEFALSRGQKISCRIKKTGPTSAFLVRGAPLKR